MQATNVYLLVHPAHPVLSNPVFPDPAIFIIYPAHLVQLNLIHSDKKKARLLAGSGLEYSEVCRVSFT